MATPALAAGPPLFDIVGSWDLRCPCTSGYIGTYDHHMYIATEDPSTGAVTGSGYYIPAPYFTWVIDSGSYVIGNKVHIELHYTAGHPDTWAATWDATINPGNGSMVGTWTDTGAPLSSSGTFFSLTGQATPIQNVDILTINQFGNGMVTADKEPPYYDGDVVTLTATPAEGWSFAGFDPSGVITMNGNVTVTAIFTENEDDNTPSMTFMIKHAKLDFRDKRDKPDDDKVLVEGWLGLALIDAQGMDVTVDIGSLHETITMKLGGKKDDKWEYKRPKGATTDIQSMTINWKNGDFKIHMDKVDLSSFTPLPPTPVTIKVTIGGVTGTQDIVMKETKKGDWDYKAPKAPKPPKP